MRADEITMMSLTYRPQVEIVLVFCFKLRFVNHAESNVLFAEMQSAYRKGHSTETTVTTLATLPSVRPMRVT